jgi:hypothetical protein
VRDTSRKPRLPPRKLKKRIELPEALVKQRIRELFTNDPFIKSIDQIYTIAGPRAAELIFNRAMEDCKYRDMVYR